MVQRPFMTRVILVAILFTCIQTAPTVLQTAAHKEIGLKRFHTPVLLKRDTSRDVSSAPVNNINATTDAATGTDQEKPACIKGTKLGAFIITSPNRSSIVVVGSDYIVQWKYTPLVKSPPKRIDVKIQQVEPRTVETWTTVVVDNLGLDSPQVQSFLWTVPQLNDGQYKIRIVPDGKETFGVTADKLPCFGDGEVVPATSGAFKVVNPVTLLPYPDKFGPYRSHAELTRMPLFWRMTSITIFIVYVLLT